MCGPVLHSFSRSSFLPSPFPLHIIMPNHAGALVAMTVPAVALAASAFPVSYAPTTTSALAPQNGAPPTLPLALDGGAGLELNETEVATQEAPAMDPICGQNAQYTFFAEQPLAVGEADSILIEECDPLHPHQIRLAYVANKKAGSTVSPTSILLGCARGHSPNPYLARQGGAFNRIAQGQYSNFVRRSSIVGGSTLIGRHPRKPTVKREMEDVLMERRWETRSDIDQYSDGYHTCPSSESSMCYGMPKEDVCLELERALYAGRSPFPTLPVKRFNACTINHANGSIQCPEGVAGEPAKYRPPFLDPLMEGKKIEVNEKSGLTRRDANNGRGAGETAIKRSFSAPYPLNDAAVKRRSLELGEARLVKRAAIPDLTVNEKRQLAGQTIGLSEQNEFMRRWLEGDEHPRRFMLLQRDEALDKRTTIDKDVLMETRSGLASRNDGGEDMNKRFSDDHTSCNSRDAQFDTRCIGKMGQGGGAHNFAKRGEGEVAMEKRKFHPYSDCNSGSARFDTRCIGKREEEPASLVERSLAEDKDDQLEKRRYYGWRGRQGGGSNRSYNSRRDIDDDDDLARRSFEVDDELEKRSHSSYSHSHGRRYGRYYRRDLEDANDESPIRRAIGSTPDPPITIPPVQVRGLDEAAGPQWLPRTFDDDALTIRSGLSVEGDIFERGQADFESMIQKRAQAGSLGTGPVQQETAAPVKRDLASSIWKLTVAPLLRRREASMVINRDVT